jgi:hypothetical protein
MPEASATKELSTRSPAWPSSRRRARPPWEEKILARRFFDESGNYYCECDERNGEKGQGKHDQQRREHPQPWPSHDADELKHRENHGEDDPNHVEVPSEVMLRI